MGQKKPGQKTEQQRFANAFVGLAFYSVMMMMVPVALFFLSSEKYFDREWGAAGLFLEICCLQGSATQFIEKPAALTIAAAIYKYTIGVPSPEKRSLVSGILAVLGVNLVSLLHLVP